MKKIRLLTNRIDKETYTSIEMEEIDGKQYLYLCDQDGCCPYSVDLVQEEFQKMGRSYIPTGKEIALAVEDLMIKGDGESKWNLTKPLPKSSILKSNYESKKDWKIALLDKWSWKYPCLINFKEEQEKAYGRT